MPEKREDPDQELEPKPLKPGVQSLFSLLLIIHLFCISICFFSVLPASDLEARLLTVLAPYLQSTHLDLDYLPYYYTRESLNDESLPIYAERQYLIEVLPAGGDPDRPEDWQRLEDLHDSWGPARQRIQRYADTASFFVDADQIVALFARDVGRHLARTQPDPPQKIRIRQHRPVPRQRYYNLTRSDDRPDPLDDQYFVTRYVAQFVIGPDGSVDVLKDVPTAEAARSGGWPANDSPGAGSDEER